MYKCLREKEEMEIINSLGYVTVDYLAKKINVSPSSVRRDLAVLQSKGLVQRSYGGVERVAVNSKKIPFDMRTHQNINEKKKIAQTAVSFVNEGNTIFVDGSSTAVFLLEELININGITIITNSIEGISLLSNYKTNVISTGGLISGENRSVLVGTTAENVINSTRADIMFFSSQSLDFDGTIYDCYLSEVSLRRKMMENSTAKVFLLDSHKVGKTSTWKQGHIDEVDFIVSEKNILDKLKNQKNKEKFIFD